jgi:hypothetical protein
MNLFSIIILVEFNNYYKIWRKKKIVWYTCLHYALHHIYKYLVKHCIIYHFEFEFIYLLKNQSKIKMKKNHYF